MKAEVEETITVTLKLSEQDARWLKAMVQNPIRDGESCEDSQMRERFWEALKDVPFF